MKKINHVIEVKVAWNDGSRNYGGGWGYPDFGAVLATGRTLEEFKSSFKESLESRICGMLADGDDVPEWLVKHDYEITYDIF